MIGEKRLFGLIALVLGLVAGVLILLDVQAKQNINLLNLIAGIGVLTAATSSTAARRAFSSAGGRPDSAR